MAELIVVRLDPLLFVTSVFSFEDFALILCLDLYPVSTKYSTNHVN